MRADRFVLTAVLAALSLPALPAADACGPDFPIELLSWRVETMAELPEGVFLEEVQRLVPAPGRYPVIAADYPAPPPPPPHAAEELLYAEGIRAYRGGDPWAAADSFEKVLDLAPAARRHRSTWAAYMLGRIDRDRRGVGWYRKVRQLVDDGYPDPIGLAASSLGQEARLVDDDIVRVQRYAEQAALGHPDGPTSLLFVVRDLIDRGAEDRILQSPIGQRLIATYLYCRSDELDDAQRTRLWDRLAQVPRPAGADQLAAAAYRAGAWDRAGQLVAGADDTAIARWVRAKLALRAGDHVAAEGLLRGAADQLTSRPDTQARVEGERAILALADGRFSAAMTHAWAARDHYRDVFYIAERVLTPDELRDFLARLPADPDGQTSEPDDRGGITAASLRNLYGRRLMRAGHWRDALPYLARADRTAAIAYGASRDDARTSTDPIAIARALYQASTIARRDGLAILGTEHGPDWATYGASYDLTEYSSAAPPGPWRGAAELVRVARSRPAAPQRYHYRYLASQLAEDAADHLPHRSQAFAATLCEATRYINHVDRARVAHLWQRYVDDGPAAVRMSFGVDCPDPAFERARRYLPPPARPRWIFVVPTAALVVAAAFGLRALRRRRQHRFAARP